jgi:steroid delta-isomerase-like uncharacterized protein
MSTDANKVLVRRYNEAWSQGNLAALDEILAEEVLFGTEHVDREHIKQFVADVRSAFPDWHVTIEDMLADGDRVAIRETMGGTHRGAWKDSPVGPLAPTGKQVTVTANVMYRIANNRIVQDVGEVDVLGMLQQLGAIPAPEQARQAGT